MGNETGDTKPKLSGLALFALIRYRFNSKLSSKENGIKKDFKQY
jgi:hypothetical protein